MLCLPDSHAAIQRQSSIHFDYVTNCEIEITILALAINYSRQYSRDLSLERAYTKKAIEWKKICVRIIFDDWYHSCSKHLTQLAAWSWATNVSIADTNQLMITFWRWHNRTDLKSRVSTKNEHFVTFISSNFDFFCRFLKLIIHSPKRKWRKPKL
jgi:hypothetical protein